MKLLVSALLLGALTAGAYITAASAACPPGTAYRCEQGFNGKVICGCR